MGGFSPRPPWRLPLLRIQPSGVHTKPAPQLRPSGDPAITLNPSPRPGPCPREPNDGQHPGHRSQRPAGGSGFQSLQLRCVSPEVPVPGGTRPAVSSKPPCPLLCLGSRCPEPRGKGAAVQVSPDRPAGRRAFPAGGASTWMVTGQVPRAWTETGLAPGAQTPQVRGTPAGKPPSWQRCQLAWKGGP